MSPCRISKLEIQGFRSFGRDAQTLEFPSPLAAVWGPNSQGKTSLAEAVEFLLTGQIVRRALLASGQDEFADALRNAHLPAGTACFVEATIIDGGGMPHMIRRTLKTDYGKKQDCETKLEVEGAAASEADLEAIGIVLSQPPLRAPVLAQHTLGYLFSTRPQDRAGYFKALLEVTDLDEIRSAVAQLEKECEAVPGPLIIKLEAAIGVAGKRLRRLLAKMPNAAAIDTAFAEACKDLIEAFGETAPANHAARIDKVEAILVEKRAKTFAIKDFGRKPLPSWSGASDDQHEKLSRYLAERAKVDEEARRLTNLFSEALALPAVADATGSIDCPLCGTDESLTTERIAFIRARVADTEAFKTAEKDARETFSQMESGLKMLTGGIAAALPAFITNPSKSRRARNFRVDKIRELLGDERKPAIDAWLAALRRLMRGRATLGVCAKKLSALIGPCAAKPEALTDAEAIQAGFAEVVAAHDLFALILKEYDRLEKAIGGALKTVVDAESKTAGWQELIDLARNQANLRGALIDQSAREQLAREIKQALKQIDMGNERVLDKKFEELSDGVQTWWDLLRPDELSFFSGVIPRPGARRTIDFKAGLSANADRSNPKLRDVIAVFSMSQLHCLGLSLFLARAVKEGAGFIVLDDPILSSDEDYRAYFNAPVIENLLALGIQIVLLTQDQRTWKDLGERYLHQNISMFQIVLSAPASGSSVTNTADDLESMLVRAYTFLRGGHPDLHKQGGGVVRDAAERFCKEMLIKTRRASGDATASLNDYDRKNLGELCPQVETLLALDPSHPGKLRAIGGAVNPAKHDDAVPAAGVLKVALGDLKFLKKKYL
jgi:hypothetical protein